MKYDDDLKYSVRAGRDDDVSVSVSGRDVRPFSDDPGRGYGAAGGDRRGEEALLDVAIDGEYDAGHKPRGCAEYSRNLGIKKGVGGVQTGRRSLGIQSRILMFE